MTNLLPHEQQDHVRREYHVRFAAAAFFAMSIVFVSGIAVVGPHLVGLWGRERAQADLLAFTESSRKTEQGLPADDTAALIGANETIAAIARTTAVPAVGDLFGRLVAHAGQEVVVTSLLYSRDLMTDDAGTWSIAMRGRARTRDALITFERRLARDPAVLRADIPLDYFTADRDITFSLTAVGTTAER